MCKRLFLVVLMLLAFKANAADFKSFDLFSSKFKTISNKEEKLKIFNLTVTAEKEFGIKKEIIWALIAVESSFRNINSGSSIGYTQLQLPTAKWIWEKYEKEMLFYKIKKPQSKSDLMDLKTQILISTAYLEFLTKYFNGNFKIALMAYNAGITGYKKANNYWYYEKIIKQKKQIF